ncbi:MAG: HAMP domain-containing histidine kinase [Proteobacteria bacterium]|nr:MAG: HAMP domain-containing histidine kinase [Pseudomonadota bacterium]
MIEIISRNMDRADRMIHDILDASRLKAGEGVPLNLRDADMKTVVTHSVETLTSLHGARFKTAFSGDLFGSWDTAAFERVLENLGSNAVKYGEPGSMITLSAKDCGDSIELRVHNVGEPIPPADLETIFEKYNRTDSAIKGPQKGWGIGLTLVKGFTEAHGGRIHVESSAINGTDFIMKIPRFTPTSLAMTLLN